MTTSEPVADAASAAPAGAASGGPTDDGGVPARPAVAHRMFAWVSVFLLIAFVIDNFLTYWGGWPGALSLIDASAPNRASTPADANGGASVFAILQAVFFAVAVALGVLTALRVNATLREDAERLHRANLYFIRACFWTVLIVGLADAAVSFLRVEGFLPAVVGEWLAGELGKSSFRGVYLHMPLVVVSFLIAMVTRTLGFTWLALLVVVAELQIVVGRFIFSYEQAFMADLVRFWYAALFLFASAYTLYEDGHVRVDVLYAGFRHQNKGRVNAIGSVLLGMTLVWVVLILGTSGSASIINSPLLSFEVTQAGFGLYVKYMMAGFLGVFAISMLLQFVSSYLESVADARNEIGRRKLGGEIAH